LGWFVGGGVVVGVVTGGVGAVWVGWRRVVVVGAVVGAAVAVVVAVGVGTVGCGFVDIVARTDVEDSAAAAVVVVVVVEDSAAAVVVVVVVVVVEDSGMTDDKLFVPVDAVSTLAAAGAAPIVAGSWIGCTQSVGLVPAVAPVVAVRIGSRIDLQHGRQHWTKRHHLEAREREPNWRGSEEQVNVRDRNWVWRLGAPGCAERDGRKFHCCEKQQRARKQKP